MARKGDVDLIIRAKNEASRTLETIARAVEKLTDAQGDLSASADKTGSSLSDIAKVAGTVSAAYSKIVSDVDRAATSYDRQERNLAELRAQHQSLTAQMEAAARVQSRLRSESEKDGADKKALADQLKRVESAYGTLASQSQRAATQIERQEKSLTESFYALQELSGGADKAAAALDKVKLAHKQAADAAAADAAAQAKAAAEVAAAQAKAAAEVEKTAQTAARRAALELKRSMTEAATAAKTTWQETQLQIKALAGEMARTGTQTSAQVADMARLQTVARANKTVYNELRVEIEQYTRVLRDQSATQAQVASAQDRAKAAMAGAANAAVQQASASRQATQATRDLGNANQKASGQTNQLEKSLQSLFANSRRSLSLYQRLRGEVLSLASSYLGLYAAIEGVNKVIGASMDMQAVESRLNVVTSGDMTKTAAEIQWVTKEADRLGFSLQTLAGEWSKFAVSAQASNFSMGQTRKIFTSVSEAGRVLKLDSQRMELAFTALTQMMSKGTIQMEELRQQLGEHIPGAFALMAEAAGVSTAELTKMMEKGQLTSDYLIKFADVLDKRFGGQLDKSLKTTQAELGRFQTRVTLALNAIAEAGVIDAFTDALRQLQEVLKSPDAQVWFDRIGAGVGGLIRALMAVLENLDLIMVALAALGAARGVAYVIKLRTAILSMIGTITAARTATVGLSVAFAGIGGPIGILLGVLAGAFTFLATRVSDSEKAMKSAANTVDEITAAYRNGTKSAKEWSESLAGLSNLQIERDLRELREKLQSELKKIAQPGAFLSIRLGNSPLKPILNEIEDLGKQVRAGEIPLEKFKQRLDEIGKAHPEFKALALAMQDSAKEAIETDGSLRRLEASIRLMQGTATEADKKLLGVAEAAGELNEAAEQGASSLDKYSAAMDRLAKNIPALKRELEFKSAFDAINKDLQEALDAAGDDESLKQAAVDRASQALAALREGFDSALIKEFAQKGDGLEASVALLKKFEGFRPTPYWDTNAYRVGYGSDTVTLDDGSIRKVTEGITVSQTDAMRDLVRRVGEFQQGIIDRIGSDRWSAFSSQQQAALTSIAYNYGSLPNRIIDAVKRGTGDEIATAIRGLRNDNNGINAGRRATEAAIFENPNYSLAANTAKQIQTQLDQTYKVVADLNKQIQSASLGDREKYIREALERAGIESVVKAVQGMLEEGNIDLTKRPQVKNADGSISTVRSISIEVDGKVALIPTVSPDGKIMSDDDAVSRFQKTGEHLGMFDSEAAAERFAEALHIQQERFYSEEARRIAQVAGEAFDTQAAEKAKVKISELQRELAGGIAGMSREEYIANEARKDGVSLLTEQGRQYAQMKGQIYDREMAEKRVNDLMETRRLLQEQLKFAQEQGEYSAVPAINEQLTDVNNRLREAIDLAIQFYEALGGPGADNAILKLKNIGSSVADNNKLVLDAKAINQSFAQGATNAFMAAGDAIGAWIDGTMDGAEAMDAIRDAFLKFAADFLRQIAQMILQQIIFNAISGMKGTGGIGGAIAGLFHSGGVAGSAGPTRMASPAWFGNAVRYHTGGIAGLKPNEVPAVLEKGEEILTREDPRHVANGGAAAPGGGTTNLKVVNAIDAPGVLEAALATKEGERVLVNYLQANRGSIRSTLGM